MNPKIYILLTIASLALVIGCTTPQSQIDQHWKAYKTAIYHGDIPTAVVEVNAIYACDTTSQSVLDTLMRLYYLQGNHVSAYNVGTQIDEPVKIHQTLIGESAMKLGLNEEAKKWFLQAEDADSTGLNLGAKYRLAALHYNDEEFDEALAVLNEIVKDEKSLELQTQISGDNSVVQNVMLYAASFNFAGFIFMDMNDFDTAETYFSEALRAQPDFVLAKNNMSLLAEKRKGTE